MHYDSWNTTLNVCLVKHINTNSYRKVYPAPWASNNINFNNWSFSFIMTLLDNYEHNDHGSADNVHDIRLNREEDYFDNTNQERTGIH